MAKHLQLDIVTPEKVTFSDAVESVSLPAWEGEMGVLPGHMPFVAALKAGELRYVAEGKTHLLAISGGFAEVGEGKVVVLAETAEMAEEIDQKRAELKMAERSGEIKSRKMTGDELEAIRANLMKEIVRLKVADKMRKRV